MVKVDPQEDFVIVFDDQTGEGLTVKQVDSMVKELREVVNKYNYDISQWGSGRQMEKAMVFRTIGRLTDLLREEITDLVDGKYNDEEHY